MYQLSPSTLPDLNALSPSPPIFGALLTVTFHCTAPYGTGGQPKRAPGVLSISNLWYCMSRAGKRGRRSSAGSLDSNMEVSWKQLVLCDDVHCENTPFIYFFFGLLCFIDSVHFVWVHLFFFFFLGCLMTCLPPLVCMHGLPASDPAPPFVGKPEISCFGHVI